MSLYIDAEKYELIMGINSFVLGNLTEVSTATYELENTDYLLHVSRTATGPCTVTIPSDYISTIKRMLLIKDKGNNAAINNITLHTEGSEKIEFNAADYVISVNGTSLGLYSDGTDLFIY